MPKEKEMPSTFTTICATKMRGLPNWAEDQKNVYINVVLIKKRKKTISD
jgi:hypothetical protein